MDQCEMKAAEDAHEPKKMMDVRLDPRLQANQDCHEEWKDHKVAYDGAWKIGDRCLPQVREWEGADSQEEDVGEQEGDADGDEELIHDGGDGPQAGWGERMQDESCSQADRQSP